MTVTGVFDLFSSVLSYPAEGYRDAVPDLQRQLADLDPSETDGQAVETARALMKLFVDETGDLSLQELEELYTRTFDINPICTLEVGWQLFGEAYERGAHLVKMREMLRRHGIEESTELPDHLCHVLKLLGQLEPEEADAYVRTSLLPALTKMLDGFARHSSPYQHVLQALDALIRHLYLQGVQTHD